MPQAAAGVDAELDPALPGDIGLADQEAGNEPALDTGSDRRVEVAELTVLAQQAESGVGVSASEQRLDRREVGEVILLFAPQAGRVPSTGREHADLRRGLLDAKVPWRLRVDLI